LKALRYPFASQIDTKWLAAPASMHSWPFLLGMLHWLVEMGKVRLPPYLRICIILLTYVLLQARLQYLESGHPTLQEPNDVPEEFEDPNHHQALAFDYYTEAYGFFLDGADAFEEQDQVLESRYGKSLYTNLWLNPLSHSSFFFLAKKNESVLADLEAKKAQLQQMKTEYEKIMSSGVCILPYAYSFQWVLNRYCRRRLSRSWRKIIKTANVTGRSSTTSFSGLRRERNT